MCAQGRNAVQVTCCTQVDANADKATLCQQQEVQKMCRRTCDLCNTTRDTSSLLWYNQPSRRFQDQEDNLEFQQAYQDNSHGKQLHLTKLPEVEIGSVKGDKIRSSFNNEVAKHKNHTFVVLLCLSVALLTTATYIYLTRGRCEHRGTHRCAV